MEVALVRGLIDQGIDMAYAYKPLHETGGLGHAFLNTLLYLDYDREGFEYPVLPFAVNCYGSKVIRNRGGARHHNFRREAPQIGPGPTPGPARASDFSPLGRRETSWRRRSMPPATDSLPGF